MMFDRARLLAAFAGVLAMTATASAQNFPSRTIIIIVPYSAGGPTDIPARFIARVVASALS